MFRSFQFAFDESFVDDDPGSHVCEFEFLPGFDLLPQGLEIPLHAIDTIRNAIDQREGLRVFGKDGSKCTGNNASKFAGFRKS